MVWKMNGWIYLRLYFFMVLLSVNCNNHSLMNVQSNTKINVILALKNDLGCVQNHILSVGAYYICHVIIVMWPMLVSCVASLPFTKPLLWPHGIVNYSLDAHLSIKSSEFLLDRHESEQRWQIFHFNTLFSICLTISTLCIFNEFISVL